jgi:hypothetical protein
VTNFRRHLDYHRTIVAYHGCDREIGERALLEGHGLEPSKNEHDWLGEGIYFWEYGPYRAEQWARWKAQRNEIDQPYVIGAYIHLGNCFDLTDTHHEVTEKDHADNLAVLESFLQDPPQKHWAALPALTGRTSFRLATFDYQPVAGRVPGATTTNGNDDGLYVLSGFGSKGFALAPLLAEWLADHLTGQPECLPLDLSRRLHIARCARPHQEGGV